MGYDSEKPHRWSDETSQPVRPHCTFLVGYFAVHAPSDLDIDFYHTRRSTRELVETWLDSTSPANHCKRPAQSSRRPPWRPLPFGTFLAMY